MPPPNEKLAAALDELRRLQDDGTRIFRSSDLTRTSRERLLKHGFLREVMRGWLMSSSPQTRPGDTTPWFATFWEFCRRYSEDAFGAAWHLSPEQSLLLHAENTTVPRQVILHSPGAHNHLVDLPFGTSFFALREKAMPPPRDLEVVRGLRVYDVAAALVRVSGDFFTSQPIETRIVLGGVRDPSPLLTRLLEGGHAIVAGRLAAVFRRHGRGEIADEIVAAMRAADHDVRERDPLAGAVVHAALPPSTPPIAARLQAMWSAARDAVLAELPRTKAIPDRGAYLHAIDDVYKLDAYHSLSIEGYRVTPELVARVASGDWDPDGIPADRDNRDALAAHGYWLAFQRVRDTVARILETGDRRIVRTAHRAWYRELFGPFVSAGLLTPAMLGGYRNAPVYLRGSRHVPPRSEVLGDAMSALFDLVEQEPHAGVAAVLAHWLVGYVHPFPDGNGRIARFVMNALFAAAGSPWTVIRVDERDAYLAALETASVGNDARPFARFVAAQMRRRRS
ncbi:MAG: Fic family protein [Deltaproteobacteria bacterium]|nr:Fic family protein [Deltaproteobacteria bacterium]